MPDFCTCGAQLPPDARFCHKCGKPQFDYRVPGDEEAVEQQAPVEIAAASAATAPQAPPEISFHNRLAVRISFIAALAAVLMVVFPLPFPFVRLLFAFLAAGFLAVYLYTRRTGQILNIRSGARMGWITGVFSFTIFSVLFTGLIVAISNEGGLATYLRQHRDQLAASGAQADVFVQALDDPAALAGGLILSLVMLFLILTLLPTLGGALGAKVLEKE